MYNVVFAYTEKTGGYEGVITWTDFPDKEYFDNWFTPELQEKHRVVAEGVSSEEAERLAMSTPMKCYIAAAYEEATDPETGEINRMIFEMKMDSALIAKRLHSPMDPELDPLFLLETGLKVIAERTEKRMNSGDPTSNPVARKIAEDMLPK